MKVLHISPRDVDHPWSGGGERYPVKLVEYLNRRTEVAARLISWPAPPRSTTTVATFARAWLGEARSADLIHVHQLNSWTTDIALLRSIASSKPIVLTDHGGGWRSPGRVLGKFRYTRLSGLAAVSDWSKTIDLDWPTTLPGTVIYGGGELSEDPMEPPATDGPDYLFVGRLVPHKGADLLVDAAPAGSTVQMIGRSPFPQYIANIEATARRRGVDLSLSLNASDDTLLRAYRAASYLVVPTRSRVDGVELKRPELLGLVVLEAYSAGLPVIGSDAGALPEILARAGMPTFVANDTSSLSTALASLPHRGSEAYIRLQERAHRAASEVGWEAAAERCVKIYKRLLGTASG